MTTLCTTLWKTSGVGVHNSQLYTEAQTTQTQDVPDMRRNHTARFVDLFGSNGVNPQSTGLITVIRFIYRFSHSITDYAHITKTRAVR